LPIVGILLFAPGGAGCSSCGQRSTGEEAERDAEPDKAPRAERDGGSDSAARPDRNKEPRPVLPEATLAAVQGAVTVDTSTRVLIPRRRLVDGGVQVEMPDGGPGGAVAGQDGTELQIGDTVKTGPDGSVDLTLPEGQGSLAVGPDSTVRVSRFAVNEWIVVRGRIRGALETPGRGRRVLKIATPTALATVAGNEVVVAVADDGATRVYALKGVTKVRAARPAQEAELADGKMVEVSLESEAGAATAVTGDAVASADEWRTGRNALVAHGAAGVIKKIAKRMQDDLAGIDAAYATLRERREKNREILKRSTEARAKRSDTVGALQEELIANSRTLVEASDLARGAAMRILLREELFLAAKERAGGASLGPAAAQIEGLSARLRNVQSETESQFRRFPRRERRERPGSGARPGQGLPRLPPLKGATDLPPPEGRGPPARPGRPAAESSSE